MIKYRLHIFIAVFIVIVIGLLVTIPDHSHKHDSPDYPNIADIEKQIKKLPVERKQATGEFKKTQKALAKLQPDRPYIVIDTHANLIYLRTAEKILFKAECSTGSGGELVDSATGNRWVFNTPKGVFKVKSKLTDPWWRKPDWAFIEENEKPPKKESERYDPEMLGDYALGFGDGYFIHGTIYERLIGVSVTHGCVRVGSDDLKKLYQRVNIGTSVYIF